MIPVARADQMRECDRQTIDDLGLPGIVLMENASRAVAAAAIELMDDFATGKKVHIYCGKGNMAGMDLLLRDIYKTAVQRS